MPLREPCSPWAWCGVSAGPVEVAGRCGHGLAVMLAQDVGKRLPEMSESEIERWLALRERTESA